MSGVHNITNDNRITNFQDVTVTFIIDSFKTRNSRGDYTLAWNAVSKYFTRGGFYSLALNPHPIPHTFVHPVLTCTRSNYLRPDRDLVCTTAISLNDFLSPYYGTTVGKFNTQTPSCGGGGNDQIFRYSLPAGFTLYIGQTNADFGGIAELTVGGKCPGTTSIRCEGGSDSSGRLMSYHNTGMYAVDVYFMVDAGSAYDMDFTIEWSATDTTTASSTTSTATINPCVSDPGRCLLFVNDGFSSLKCQRILSKPERRAGVLRQAKQELRKAYAQAVGRTLGEGEQLSDSFVRCGSVWLDMPVQVQDQPALRSYFRRQPLWLFVGTQRVMFRLVGDSVSSSSTSTSSTITDIVTMVPTTMPPDVEPQVEQYGTWVW